MHNATVAPSSTKLIIVFTKVVAYDGEVPSMCEQHDDFSTQVELAYIARANQKFVEEKLIRFELGLLRHRGITLVEYRQQIAEEARLAEIGLDPDLTSETQRRRPNQARMQRLTTGRYVVIKDRGTTARKRQIAATNAARDSRTPHSVRAKRRQAKSTRYAK